MIVVGEIVGCVGLVYNAQCEVGRAKAGSDDERTNRVSPRMTYNVSVSCKFCREGGVWHGPF